MYFIVYSILTLITVTSIVECSTVTIKRADGESDSLKFTSTDVSICGKYNAVYDYKTYYTVHCKCTSTNPSFYSISSTAQPSCHHSNAANLGCVACTSECIAHIKYAYPTKYSFGWQDSKSTFSCNNRNGKYFIKKWDGKTWNYFYKAADFELKFTVESGKYVMRFWWDRTYPARELKAYAGHLFLISSYCGTRKINCFLASADGERSFDIIPPTRAPPTKASTTKAPRTKASTTRAPSTKAPSTKASSTKASSSASTNVTIGVAVGVVAVVIIIFLLVICCVCINKRNKKYKDRNEQRQFSTTHAPPPTSPSFEEAAAPPFVIPATREMQPPQYSQQQFQYQQPPQQMFAQAPITHQQLPPPQLPPYTTVTHIPAMSPIPVIQQPIVFSTQKPVQITPNNNLMYTTTAQPTVYMQQPKKNKKPRKGGNIAPRIIDGVVDNAVESFVESTASGLGGMFSGFFEE